MTKLNEIERAALEDLFIGFSDDTIVSRILFRIKKLFNIH